MNVVLSDATWRFLTDPISHALWVGIAGYFIGLAIQQYRRGMVKQAAIALGCTGFVMASILHGINDWDVVTGHFGWILITLASVLMFLGYARAGTSAEAVSAATEAITSKDFDGPRGPRDLLVPYLHELGDALPRRSVFGAMADLPS